jgi:hypothetical protein
MARQQRSTTRRRLFRKAQLTSADTTNERTCSSNLNLVGSQRGERID